MKRDGMLSVVMAAGFVLGGTGAAFAASPPSSELSVLDHAKTSMRQAIAIAQDVTGGKATRVAFSDANGQPIYCIRTLTKQGSDRVVIDAKDGTVTTVASAEPVVQPPYTPDSYRVFSAPECRSDHS